MKGLREYKSFYKVVRGGERIRCRYNSLLDSDGCGCAHDCGYCYAKSLLEFCDLWHPEDSAVADIRKIERVMDRIPNGTILRLGGMTDCFQPIEKYFRVTYLLLKELNKWRIGYLIVTKSAMAANPKYTALYDPDLAHIHITVTSTDDDKTLEYENASPVSERIAAAEKLQEMGFDVSIRLSPFIPEYIDFDRLNAIKCDKIVVEFLRSNAYIRKSFPIDYSEYTVRSGGYRQLPLEKKKALIFMIIGFKEVTVCEDEPKVYEYWKHHFNPDPDDCCNLKKGMSICRKVQ